MAHLERNPADERERDQRALELVFVGAAASYFVTIQGISLATIRRAISRANPAPILEDPAWLTASEEARKDVADIYERLARFGGRTAIAEIPQSMIRPNSRRAGAVRTLPDQPSIAFSASTGTQVSRDLPAFRDLPELRRDLPEIEMAPGRAETRIRLRQQVPAADIVPQAAQQASIAPASEALEEIIERIANTDAIALIQGVDSRTRSGIRAMVRRAAREYRAQPSPQLLRKLAESIQGQIGLTEKQAAIIRRIESRLVEELGDQRAVDKIIQQKTERLIELRAKQIADRGVIEIVSKTRHEAWRAAIRSGELPPGTQKRWQDQGDDRVRPRHMRQTDMGPVDFDSPYPVFGVDHPPAPEHGCRCWEVLVLP